MSDETKSNLAAVSNHFAFYWLDYVIFFAVLGNSMIMIILAALQGVTWKTLDGQTKFLIALTVLGNMSGVIVAYCKQMRSRIKAGKDPFDSGDSDPQAFTKKP
jgi:hypothetical protein